MKSIYSSVASCVRVNNYHTDWFEVKCGLRQGCILSPLLFNLYINDLAIYIRSVGKGVLCNDDIISILLYADDLVLLAETQHDLQCLLNALNDWCKRNDMTVNIDKSNVVHFRRPSVPKTDFVFKCGDNTLKIVDKYTYLGMLLTEHLDYELTAKNVAKSASRALGLLIAKCKLAGGLPYNVFTKLYNSMVWPVVSYSACIWGVKQYSCINAVQNRAMRFYLGVGKYTPNNALIGEMGWEPAYVRQWSSVCQQYTRLSRTNITRLNKRIALWAFSKASASCKNRYFVFRKYIAELDLDVSVDISDPIPRSLIDSVKTASMDKFIAAWYAQITDVTGPSRRGRNKLRTYCMYKYEFETENYCKIILPLRHRAAFAKFRCGVAPLRIETGRYENIAFEDRKCNYCDNIETETHVLFECQLYEDIRQDLFSKANNIDSNFSNLSKNNKLIFLFSNKDMIRASAKTCFNILQKRSFYLCK